MTRRDNPTLFQRLHGIRRRLLPPSSDHFQRQHRIMLERLEVLQDSVRSLSAGLEALGRQAGLERPRTGRVPVRQEEILGLLRRMAPGRVERFGKVRIGCAHDGGYVMLEDFSGIACALSLGISDNDSWDLDIARRNIGVHQFDPTIDGAPSIHPLLHFHKVRVAGERGEGLATLGDLIAEHAGAVGSGLLLKVDIEGSEWEAFDACPPESLARCAQIVCEFHTLDLLAEPAFRAVAERVFTKLLDDFHVVHIHANNYGRICNLANIAVPETLEITFASKARYPVAASDERFPTALDSPNDPAAPDIHLGAWTY